MKISLHLCFHMMSAKKGGGVKTSLLPLVIQKTKIKNPPLPLVINKLNTFANKHNYVLAFTNPGTGGTHCELKFFVTCWTQRHYMKISKKQTWMVGCARSSFKGQKDHLSKLFYCIKQCTMKRTEHRVGWTTKSLLSPHAGVYCRGFISEDWAGLEY